ncbi:MAG: response regulator transcription factor [Gammaproteobacteria bacterium]|nr:response regulator transcription factor [Gammaproteobacteria bacterium]MCY4219560.1 response regulator transcription factor [Gammaproteobacteria bacterium]MCY4274627.1 response regulator transcription factor [Gammaproteobacteria bacterium]
MKAVLIDDHTLFREGLEGLLRRRGVEVTSFSSGADGIESVSSECPDVVMVDLRMPELDGVQTLKTLRKNHTDLPILILTTSDDTSDLTDCLHHQANGYLLKDMDPDELVAAMKKVILGEVVVAPQLAGKLASIIQKKKEMPEDSDSIFDCLSPREMEILCHLTEGQSNKRIALDLGISDGTVKLHVKSILKKLGLHSRVEAAVLAVREGLTYRL